MNEPEVGLMVGERQRRRLLWALSALQPGDRKSIALLDEQDALERRAREITSQHNGLRGEPMFSMPEYLLEAL